MTSERIPSDLGERAVVLVQIFASMRKYDIRLDRRAHAMHGLLDLNDLRWEQRVIKIKQMRIAMSATFAPSLKGIDRFLLALRVAAEHSPIHMEVGVFCQQAQEGATASNFDVIWMGADAKYGLCGCEVKVQSSDLLVIKRLRVSGDGLGVFWIAIRFSPNLPRSFARSVEIVKHLLLLERIHASEKSVMIHAIQLVLGDQAIEWVGYDLLARMDLVEDRLLKDEVAGIHSQIRFGDGGDVSDRSVFVGVDAMKRLSWSNGHKSCNRFVFAMAVNQVCQMNIAEPIGVVRQKGLLTGQVRFHCFQPLPNVGPQSCVNERYLPVVDISTEEMD